jgi:hypothetical protein
MKKDNADKISSLIRRHKNFWKRTEAGRPLFGFRHPREHNVAARYGIGLGPLKPEMLDPRIFIDEYRASLEEGGLFDGDLFKAASATQMPLPDYPNALIPWSEAIMGCEVEILQSSICAKESDRWDLDTDVDEYTDNNPWLDKAIEITKLLQNEFADFAPVAAPSLRGPADMLSSLMGMERLCLEIADNPGKVRSLLAVFSEIWLRANKKLEEISIEYFGGCVESRFEIWSPDNTVVSQEDCAMLFSPSAYQNIFMEINRKIIDSDLNVIMHVHSSALRTVEYLLKSPELKAIEIHCDGNGPKLEAMLPVFKKIQTRLPLIIQKAFKIEELDVLLNNLSFSGLCIMNRFEEGSEETIKYIKSIMADDDHL